MWLSVCISSLVFDVFLVTFTDTQAYAPPVMLIIMWIAGPPLIFPLAWAYRRTAKMAAEGRLGLRRDPLVGSLLVIVLLVAISGVGYALYPG